MERSEARRRFEQVPLSKVPAPSRDPGRPKVLNVSPDPTLLQTRGAILRRAGAAVVNAGGYEEAMRACGNQEFAAVVLCHALLREPKSELIQAIRRRQSDAKVIGLFKFNRSETAGADLTVDSHDGPEALLRALRPLL